MVKPFACFRLAANGRGRARDIGRTQMMSVENGPNSGTGMKRQGYLAVLDLGRDLTDRGFNTRSAGPSTRSNHARS